MDALDADLSTPLHCAIVHGHADAARALVQDLKVGRGGAACVWTAMPCHD